MVEFVKFKEKKNDEDDNSSKSPKRKPIITFKRVIWITIGVILLSILISSCTVAVSPKIAIVPINGEITTAQSSSLFQVGSPSSRSVANQIYTLADDSTVKGIILDINSPGGSPVASDEISQAISYATSQKPVYSVFSDLGASGAYWIAVSSDKIYSAPLSIVGSIGVTSAMLSFEDFIEEWNITYRSQVAGEFKDMGSLFREPTDEEQKMIQELLDTVHQEFINHIAGSRNLSVEEVTQLATGEIFLGKDAIDLKLVDEIGYIRDVVDDMKNETGYNESLVMTYSPSIQRGGFFSINSPFDSFLPKNTAVIELK